MSLTTSFATMLQTLAGVDNKDERRALTLVLGSVSQRLRARARITESAVWSSRSDGIVPLAVEACGLNVEGGHLGVGDLDSLLVEIGVELARDREAGFSGGAGDQADDDQVADQRLGTPVHGDGLCG